MKLRKILGGAGLFATLAIVVVVVAAAQGMTGGGMMGAGMMGGGQGMMHGGWHMMGRGPGMPGAGRDTTGETGAGAGEIGAGAGAGSGNAAAQAGKGLFLDNCASCHGENGAGGMRIGDATSADLRAQALGEKFHGDDKAIARAMLTGIAENGRTLSPVMPRFQGSLSPAEVSSLVDYLKSLRG